MSLLVAGGRLTLPVQWLVTGEIIDLTAAYIKAVWGKAQLEARADFNAGKDPAPLLIVVKSPRSFDPPTERGIGSNFTQDITIENRDATRSSLPLSAWQMDVVYNPLILEVVGVSEGDFLTEAGNVSTYYTEKKSSGRIRVSQSRPGHIDNDPMSPDAKDGMDDEATASSPAWSRC